jgi:uncharacterized membrane protein YhaH (DUF805 family)
MNWFQRHLNWSLVLGIFYIPLNIGITIGLLISIIGIVGGLISHGFGYELSLYLVGLEATIQEDYGTILGILVLLLGLAAVIMVTLWYLRNKGRSGWYVLLLVAPPFIGFISTFFLGVTGFIIAFGGPIIGLIILLLLGNQTMDYGGDFVSEPAGGDYWRPDTGRFVGYDSEQLKELDYRPAKNVEDIAYGGVAKDVGAAGASSGEVPPPLPPEVPPEPPVEFSVEAVDEVPAEAPAVTPTEAKVAEEPARPEALKMPILLDDAGAVIRCFYHPDADAVNMCSRCGQYVCSQCNYLTGTHPICRNCWERRGQAPAAGMAVGAGESAKPGKAEKVKPEKDERLREFMQLYEHAAPIISNVIKREADGSPSPPLELMEGLKLRPILEQVQKLPKPDGKELQEAMKEFEQLLLSCIKVAEAAAGLVSAGEEAVPGEEDLTRLSMDIATANGLMQSLSQRLASLSQSPGG